MTNLSGTSGPMLFSGSLDKPGTVSVNGVPAAVNAHTTNFTGYASVSPGTNVVQVVAADAYGNSRTNNYQIVVTNNGVAQTITCDLNGNQVSASTSSSTNTYEWDGADRLTAINAATNRSEFTYDGFGRRVQIVEKQNGSVVSTKKFVWVGMEICEERDSTGTTVTKRFFAQGEQISGTNYFFSRDHLGSVREMTDGSGPIRARYDYDPYGRRTKVQGDLEADFAFTGHYLHSVSGLYLAAYRSYDSDIGRWLSRDPLGEGAGPGLYSYGANNPSSYIDPFGLASIPVHHNLALEYYWDFLKSGINPHELEWLNKMPQDVHAELHARGWNDEIFDFFYPRSGSSVKRTSAEASALLARLKTENADLFQLAGAVTKNFKGYVIADDIIRTMKSLGKGGKALGALGLLAGLATVSASAQSIGCELKDFANDRASGRDDWAYVDALSVRQELNARGAFAGDFAMRAMYVK